MTQASSFKSFPLALPTWVRPMFIISLGLHLAIMLTPQGKKPPETPVNPPEKQETIKISQISATKPKPKAPKQARPVAAKPKSTVTAIPSVKADLPPKAPGEAGEAGATGEQTGVDPFADFPQYPGSQPGSFGLLSQGLEQASFQTPADAKTVADFFLKELPKKKFKISPSGDSAEIKVYQVTKGESTPQFLHLITQPGKGIVILLAPQVFTLQQLQSMNIEVETPEKRAMNEVFAAMEEEWIVSTVDITQLADPDKFAPATGGSQIEHEGGKVKVNLQEPTALAAADLAPLLQEKLGAVGFTMEPAGEYGGGPLYKLTNGSFVRYLNLPSTQSGEAAIFVWKDLPQ